MHVGCGISTLWLVRYIRPVLLWAEKDSWPVDEPRGCMERPVRGGDVYISCSRGRWMNPSRSWSMTQLCCRRGRQLALSSNDFVRDFEVTCSTTWWTSHGWNTKAGR